jgi:hypothetical protein
MAAEAAEELEAVANAALLLALQALLGGGDSARKDGVAAAEALDRLLLSGTRAYDAGGSRDDLETTHTSDTFESVGGADATVWRVHRYLPSLSLSLSPALRNSTVRSGISND